MRIQINFKRVDDEIETHFMETDLVVPRVGEDVEVGTKMGRVLHVTWKSQGELREGWRTHTAELEVRERIPAPPKTLVKDQAKLADKPAPARGQIWHWTDASIDLVLTRYAYDGHWFAQTRKGELALVLLEDFANGSITFVGYAEHV